MTDLGMRGTASGFGVWHPLLWGVVGVWFGAVMLLVQRGVFMTDGPAVPFPLALAAVLPGVTYL